jgi:hypothetical protein
MCRNTLEARTLFRTKEFEARGIVVEGCANSRALAD